MKFFKYLIFLSILSGIFFVIYGQSDEKGFRRWLISFKIAIYIAASLAGLILPNAEAMEHPGNNNQVYQERFVSDQEFNSFEDNYQDVILVKVGDSSPSIPISTGKPNPFPTTTGGRPTPPSKGVNLHTYRPAPKFVDQGLGGANPGGGGPAGGGAGAYWGPEFDDKCPAPKKEQQNQKNKKEFESIISNKQESEQCELNQNQIVTEKFETNAIEKLVNKALENQRVKQEYEGIKKRLQEGINPFDIGKKSTKVSSDKLIKAKHGRYLVQISGNQVNILGIGARGNDRNMATFKDLMNRKYDVNLQY